MLLEKSPRGKKTRKKDPLEKKSPWKKALGKIVPRKNLRKNNPPKKMNYTRVFYSSVYVEFWSERWNSFGVRGSWDGINESRKKCPWKKRQRKKWPGRKGQGENGREKMLKEKIEKIIIWRLIFRRLLSFLWKIFFTRIGFNLWTNSVGIIWLEKLLMLFGAIEVHIDRCRFLSFGGLWPPNDKHLHQYMKKKTKTSH